VSWIKIIDEADAEGFLAKLYQRYREPDGTVDNILKVHSISPRSMKAHFDLYALLMRGRSFLSRAQREMIAVVASTINECHY
jgi:alkylhydroperoxidase family enzyme